MKDKQEILSEICRRGTVEIYVRKLAADIDPDTFDDIVGELYLILCELKKSVVEEIYNGCGLTCFQRYVYVIVKNQVMSKNSRVYWKCRRPSEKYIPASQVPQFNKLWEESLKDTE